MYDIYFSSALYGFKGFLLVFGIFLAWETKNVNVKGLDDSKIWFLFLEQRVFMIECTREVK